MQYFKVKPTSDLQRIGIVYKTSFLIKNEIYTAREIEKALEAGRLKKEDINKHFSTLNISPKNTYFFFGARFHQP